MNILVIGGTGFISARLVSMLRDRAHRLSVLTRGLRSESSCLLPGVEYLTADRSDSRSLGAAVRGRTFDAVFDMIAYRPEESEAACRLFTGRVGRFIHCSTVSVYMISDAVRCPVTEDQALAPVTEYRARNPFGMEYGILKRRCEKVLWDAYDEKQFPVSILRPVFVSGPGDPAGRDHFWIERILDGRPLLVPGSGDNAFQQVFVDDVAAAFSLLLERPESVGKSYNITGAEVLSLNEYLAALAGLLEKRIEIVHVDQDQFDGMPLSNNPRGDVFPYNTRRTAVFSIDAARSDLGYRPSPFQQWMRSVIRWCTAPGRGHSLGYDRRGEEVKLAEALAHRDGMAKRGISAA